MTIRGANYPRQPNDYYPTPPEALDVLFNNVRFNKRAGVCDPACGKLKRVLVAAKRHGYHAVGGDIIYRRGNGNFFDDGDTDHNIVTNPPFGQGGKLALRFIEHALETTKLQRRKVAMLLPIDFDSGKTRQHVFAHRAFALKIVLLDRIKWFNGKSGSTNHCWCVWDWKHEGPPIIKYARIEHAKRNQR